MRSCVLLPGHNQHYCSFGVWKELLNSKKDCHIFAAQNGSRRKRPKKKFVWSLELRHNFILWRHSLPKWVPGRNRECKKKQTDSPYTCSCVTCIPSKNELFFLRCLALYHGDWELWKFLSWHSESSRASSGTIRYSNLQLIMSHFFCTSRSGFYSYFCRAGHLVYTI